MDKDSFTIIKIAIMATIIAIVLPVFNNADAASFPVTNTNSSGTGSFRQAIVDANAAPGFDEIEIVVSGTAVITAALPSIDEDLTITVDGGGLFVVDGQNLWRIIVVAPTASVQIYGNDQLSFYNGRADSFTTTGMGGCIHNSGALSITECMVLSSTADINGGGIYNSGILNIDSCSVLTNVAGGNAEASINDSSGILSITGGNVSNNSTYGVGGGLANRGIADITSTFEKNTSVSGGGGIYNDGSIDLINGFLKYNFNDEGGGGAIYNEAGGEASITTMEIFSNTDDSAMISPPLTGGGGVYNNGL